MTKKITIRRLRNEKGQELVERAVMLARKDNKGLTHVVTEGGFFCLTCALLGGISTEKESVELTNEYLSCMNCSRQSNNVEDRV